MKTFSEQIIRRHHNLVPLERKLVLNECNTEGFIKADFFDQLNGGFELLLKFKPISFYDRYRFSVNYRIYREIFWLLSYLYR